MINRRHIVLFTLIRHYHRPIIMLSSVRDNIHGPRYYLRGDMRITAAC